MAKFDHIDEKEVKLETLRQLMAGMDGISELRLKKAQQRRATPKQDEEDEDEDKNKGVKKDNPLRNLNKE